MLPNRFPDGGEPPEYNTADATLWFFLASALPRAHAAIRCLRELFPVSERSSRGTSRARATGSASIGRRATSGRGAGSQLTWMDAKVGDWVVTPRIGKCVEINALWYNALQRHDRTGASAGRGRRRGALLRRAARARREQFQSAFLVRSRRLPVSTSSMVPRASWTSSADIATRVFGPISYSPSHCAIRCCATDARPRRGRCVRPAAVDPVGLRSLAPARPAFAGRYRGGHGERDGAYHQGTVWSWLLGPFARAHFRAYGDAALAQSILSGSKAICAKRCLGQVSEIFEGDAPSRRAAASPRPGPWRRYSDVDTARGELDKTLKRFSRA